MRALFAPSSGARARGLLHRPALPTGARPIGTSAAVSRQGVAAAAASRLVLTPTGSGSCDHIGAKVPLPQPIPLKDGVYEVGRSAPADILLPIPTVSTRHALLRVEDGTMYVTDLNSTNGTMVNGMELSPMDNVAVEVGQEVTFGDWHLARFQLDLAAPPATPAADAAAGAAAGAAAAAFGPAAGGGGKAGGAAAGSGSSGTGDVSGTVVLPPEDSGEAPAGGGEQGSERRRSKRSRVDSDFIY